MEKSKIYKYSISILIAIIIIISFLYLLRPITDPDFFWHLKTGEWIWQNKKLPDKDLFSYTTSPTITMRESTLLTSPWFSQVIFYLFYLGGGMSGIIFLRFILVAVLLFFMIKRRHGDNTIYMGFLIIFLISIMETFPLERPHVFSFLFFAIILYLLEKIKSETKVIKPFTLHATLCALPLLMLIWANMHGGYILGLATIFLFMVTEGLKFIHPSFNPLEKDKYKKLLVAGIAGIIFSMINPHSYHFFNVLGMPSYHIETNIEFQSTILFFKVFNDYSKISYWFLMFLTFTTLLGRIKKPDITQIILLTVTGYISFTQTRYVPVFLIAALPVTGSYLSENRIFRWGKAFVIPIALFSVIFFIRDEIPNLNNISSGKWINDNDFPVRAAEFVRLNNLKGNLYNNYDWGGYLIWRLAPERKVFIDGRFLDEKAYLESLIINMAEKKEGSDKPEWKLLFDKYDIKYAIVSPFWPSGAAVPLANELLKDKDWALVFSDFNSMVFVKNSPENADVISEYSIPKKILYK